MDYAQKVHKFEAGLPGLIGKNNFMLSEISRNSKEIFEYASKFMDKKYLSGTKDVSSSDKAMQVDPVLGHQFSSGQAVSVFKCDKSNMHDVLFQVLRKFSQDGVEFDDMAILVSKKKDSDAVKDSIKNANLFGSITNDMPDSISPGGNESSLRTGFDKSVITSKVISTSSYPASCSLDSVGKGCNLDFVGKGFSDLKTQAIADQNVQQEQNDKMVVVSEEDSTTPLHGTITRGNSTPQKSESDPVLVSTVRDFSGLDKPVIVGIEPHTNPNHADLEKMILNMATRAKDSLVILTTSDDIMDMLKPQK